MRNSNEKELTDRSIGSEEMLQLLEVLKQVYTLMEDLIRRPAVTNNYYISGHYFQNPGNVYFGDKKENAKVTDETIARALVVINGKDKAIDSQRAWLGACLLLGWKYRFPRNLKDCCERINGLHIEKGMLEYECVYNSIRLYGSWKFVKEEYDNWVNYTPRDDERQIFEKSLSVAQILDEEIQRQGNIDFELAKS